MSLWRSSSGQLNSHPLHRCPASDVPPEGSVPAAPGESHLTLSQHLADPVPVVCPFPPPAPPRPLHRWPTWPAALARAPRPRAPLPRPPLRRRAPGPGEDAREASEHLEREEGRRGGTWPGPSSFKGASHRRPVSSAAEIEAPRFPWRWPEGTLKRSPRAPGTPRPGGPGPRTERPGPRRAPYRRAPGRRGSCRGDANRRRVVSWVSSLLKVFRQNSLWRNPASPRPPPLLRRCAFAV